MERYDVVIVGGSIAGSVAARFIAEKGLKTLLVEKVKTPREKACSGIQFGYFEKLVGKKIPREKLCTNPLKKIHMEWPNGRSFHVSFKMLNFTRGVFDSWLNDVAIEAGAEFRDAVRCTGFDRTDDGFTVSLRPKHGEIEEVETKYLVAADGLSSTIRKMIRPQDYHGKGERAAGITLNYYLRTDGDGDLDPNTLYQFWNIDFNNLMFAWTYKKNDLWVVGTGYTENIKEHCDLLLEYVKTKYNLEGEIVKREGFASKFRLNDPKHVFLGEDNLLLIGDAAGLVEPYRGLGMDAAALSGRRGAEAILKAEKTSAPAIELYEKSMQRLVKRIDKNVEKQLVNLKDNEELMRYLKKSFLKTGLSTFLGNIINRFLPADKQILLPL